MVKRSALFATILLTTLLQNQAYSEVNKQEQAMQRERISASELERQRLAGIVLSLDHLLKQVDVAQQTGASGRISFNYEALRNDLIGRRILIQSYINGSWSSPRGVAPLSKTYVSK